MNLMVFNLSVHFGMLWNWGFILRAFALKVWRSQPLGDQYQEKPTQFQQFNPIRWIVNLCLKASAPLLGPLLEKAGNSCGLHTVIKFGMWLQRQGFDRVFLIYQDCELAL